MAVSRHEGKQQRTMYNMKPVDYMESYIGIFAEQMKQGQYVDLKLVLSDGNFFMVHKCVAAGFSKRLHTMLMLKESTSSTGNNRRCTVLNLPPMITVDGVEPVLGQMYSSPRAWRVEKHVSMENVLNVIKAARYFDMRTDIASKSEAFLKKKLNARNVVGMLERAEKFMWNDPNMDMMTAVVCIQDCMRQCLYNTIRMPDQVKPITDGHRRQLIFAKDELEDGKLLQYMRRTCLCAIHLGLQLRGLVNIGNMAMLRELGNWISIDPEDMDRAIDSCRGDTCCSSSSSSCSSAANMQYFLSDMRDLVVKYNNKDVCERVVLQIRNERLRHHNHFTSLAIVIRCKETGRYRVTFREPCLWRDIVHQRSNTAITNFDVPCSKKEEEEEEKEEEEEEEEDMDFITIHGFLVCRSKSGKHCYILDTTKISEWHRLSGPDNHLPLLHAMSNMGNVGTKVFVAGYGMKNGTKQFFVYQFSFEEKKWSVLCEIPEIIHGAKLFTWLNKIYIFGVLEAVTPPRPPPPPSPEDEKENGEWKSVVDFWGFIEIDSETGELKILDACPRSSVVKNLIGELDDNNSYDGDDSSNGGSNEGDETIQAQELIPKAKMFVFGNTLYTDLDMMYNLQKGEWVLGYGGNYSVTKVFANTDFCYSTVGSNDRRLLLL